MHPFLSFFSSASVRENGLACASSYRVFSLDRPPTHRVASRAFLLFSVLCLFLFLYDVGGAGGAGGRVSSASSRGGDRCSRASNRRARAVTGNKNKVYLDEEVHK